MRDKFGLEFRIIEAKLLANFAGNAESMSIPGHISRVSSHPSTF